MIIDLKNEDDNDISFYVHSLEVYLDNEGSQPDEGQSEEDAKGDSSQRTASLSS